MIKVLFVCLGNICRSPMAEFLFQELISKKQWKTNFKINSCATSNEEIGKDMIIYSVWIKVISKIQ